MGFGVAAAVQACGTDNVPIDVARPKSAMAVAPLTAPGCGKSDRNAAVLFIEFSWATARSDGADSELSLDRADATGERDASNAVRGDSESVSVET
jgi:hypothetical protein